MDEFSLIERCFKPCAIQRDDVLLGIGDDAACVRVPQGHDLLVSTDTLVSGVHFLPEWNPYDIAYRAVMVNVSDMAAMAAQPNWVSLALTLPEADMQWLDSFSKGLKHALALYHVDLIGGDTTKGPLSITLSILGTAPAGHAIKRQGAKPGDVILVSGSLGAASLAIKLLNNEAVCTEHMGILMDKLLHPQPRVDLIELLREYASASIDISDGLSADLNHICVASGVGACLTEDLIPVHALVKQYWQEQALELALTGGDDYELCFTVAQNRLDDLMNTMQQEQLTCYPIGTIEAVHGLRIRTVDGALKELTACGYAHF